MDKDSVLFSDKSFADILSDVYNNTKKKEAQINGLVDQLKNMITSLNDAGALVPLIKEYLEISVKNDDNLVRLASIIQRLIVSAGKQDGAEGSLSEEEKKQLLTEAQSMIEESNGTV